MTSRLPNSLPWQANGCSRHRHRGWTGAAFATTLGGLLCLQSAFGQAPASRPAMPVVPMPRLIRLIDGVPNCFTVMKARLMAQQASGSAGPVFSVLETDAHFSEDRGAGASRATLAQYENGTKLTSVLAGRNSLCYWGSTGITRCCAVYDRHLVSTVLVAVGTAGSKRRTEVALPAWLGGRARAWIYDWNAPRRLSILPSLSSPPNPLSLGIHWGSVTALTRPYRVILTHGPGGCFVRLRFGRWARNEGLPRLTCLYLGNPMGRNGHKPFSMAVRTGRLAVPMPIHLTAKGLKKLGFTVVYLTAKTPAPAINPLTPTDEAKIKIMRRRFEKWAGVWSRLHPGPQIKAKKADGHK